MRTIFMALLLCVLSNVAVAATKKAATEYSHTITNADCEKLRSAGKSVAEWKAKGVTRPHINAYILQPELLADSNYRAMLPSINVVVDYVMGAKNNGEEINLIGTMYTSCMGTVGDLWYYYE